MSTSIGPKHAAELIELALRVRLPVMLKGSPGIGKSEIIRSIAAKFGLKLIDLRLADCEPPDLNGFPDVNSKTGRAFYAPMSHFPLEHDEVPEGYNGWLLFLDELNAAPDAIQRASYKLLLDHEVGQHKLHERCLKVAAGNLATDNAIVEEMGTAQQSRLLHLNLQVNHKDWLDWAKGQGIDHRITSFIEFKPSLLHDFNPDHNDETFACPRTWVFADRLVNGQSLTDWLLPLIEGTISEGVAKEFQGFCKIAENVATIEQITASPETIEVPNRPDIQFAQTGAISANTTKSNISKLITYINRLPMEFQVLCMGDIVKRNPEMFSTPEVDNWMTANQEHCLL